MSQKLYLNILKFGSYASLLCVFLVFKGLLFPFITSKQIVFNVIIEVLLVFWAAFIIKYPEYRPKKSWITFGLFGFFLALLASCTISVDFNLSFWGDIERMLGVFHLLHFLGFYLILITAFREWKDWKILLIISIIFATLVSFVGLPEDKKAYSTIGNTAYVSGYLIFNMYFAMILFFREKTGLKWLYLAPIPIMILEFDKANTTGALVGLGFSLIILSLLYTFLSKNKTIKIITLVSFLFLASLVTAVLTNRNSDWVKHNRVFDNIVGIDVNKSTFQTRLISWKAAIADFPRHPILGTGHGNYAIIFDRHFDASFYNYTDSETYFDRAHNNVIDILSTSGLAGAMTYLFIFLALAYYLIKGFIKKYIDRNEFILISSLVIAYFVQNLAVFDSLVTYMGLMIVLGYVFWLYNEGEETLVEEAGQSIREKINALTKDRKLDNPEILSLALVGLLMIVIIFQYNYKPYKMLNLTIDAQRDWSNGQLKETHEKYKEALALNTVLDRDSRTSMLRLWMNPNKLIKLKDPELIQEVIDFNIKAAEDNVAYNRSDSLNQMLLAEMLNTAATVYRSKEDKFIYYSDRALEAIDDSIAASPGRVPVYYQKAQIQLTRGMTEQALETLRTAVSLNPDYVDSSCHLGRTLIYYKQEEEGYKSIDECIDKEGANRLIPADFVKALANHYAQNNDLIRLAKLAERLVVLEPKNANNLVNLAKIYAQIGETQKAKEAASKATQIDPSIEQYANDFINSLQ